MVLSGAMFSFEKLNRNISRIDKVPLLAEFMPTRWSYEALMVNQFKQNRFQVNFYDLEKDITNADFKISYYLPELESRLIDIKSAVQVSKIYEGFGEDVELLKNEIISESIQTPVFEAPNEGFFNPDSLDMDKISQLEDIISELKLYYLEIFSRNEKARNNKVKNLLKNKKDTYYEYLNDFHNESLSDHVRKIYERKKIVAFDHRLVRMIDPVFRDPVPQHPLDFRTHFFAPRKHFLGRYFDTFNFNMTVIWILSALLYALLYFDVLGRIVRRKG